MERLIKDLTNSPVIPQNYLPDEIKTVKSSLASFNTLVQKFRSILRVRNISNNFLFYVRTVIYYIARVVWH